MRVSTIWIAGLVGLIAVGASDQGIADDSVGVTVSAVDCQRLVRHQTSADVAYKPGVDVNGNPVAAADLPGTVKIKTPTEITFDVTFDLLGNYGVAEDSTLFARGAASVGTVKYDINSGALSFNGERLDDPEIKALADLCAAAQSK